MTTIQKLEKQEIIYYAYICEQTQRQPGAWYLAKPLALHFEPFASPVIKLGFQSILSQLETLAMYIQAR
ncbi:hypothetical protein FGO68_gene17349 [Halteria grandinella]|uniref:Uncharacterized protein n=1 Tax=Halteria grandinella TaxID=5974 RepID=A0A8J8NDJ9_HALGN|nr:hypothetical protein FGO68_gene17349 [Halteria grandinella]